MDSPSCNGDCKGIIRVILGSYYIPSIPLLQRGGVLLSYRVHAGSGFECQGCFKQARAGPFKVVRV